MSHDGLDASPLMMRGSHRVPAPSCPSIAPAGLHGCIPASSPADVLPAALCGHSFTVLQLKSRPDGSAVESTRLSTDAAAVQHLPDGHTVTICSGGDAEVMGEECVRWRVADGSHDENHDDDTPLLHQC